MDLIFWSLEVIRLGCVFYEGKVQAHLISSSVPRAPRGLPGMCSTKRVFSEHGIEVAGPAGLEWIAALE